MYIAFEGGKTVTVQEIFEKEDVSKRYLEQIFSELKKYGLIKSIKGKHGGYFISKPAKEVTILDIVVSLEGKLGSVIVSNNKALERVVEEQLCIPLKDSMEAIMSHITLESLVTDYNQRQSNMFYI